MNSNEISIKLLVLYFTGFQGYIFGNILWPGGKRRKWCRGKKLELRQEGEREKGKEIGGEIFF